MSAACPRCGYSETPALRAWTIRLDLDTPTQNHVAKNAGRMRFQYKRMRDAMQALIRKARQKQRIPKAKRKRRVRIVRHYGGHSQERDYGNLVGGCKMLVDCLVREGLLVDDAPACVDDFYEQRRIAEKTCVEIVIEEVQP